MLILAICVGLAIGTGLATQSLVNADVTRSLGLWGATFLSFAIGACWMLIAALLTGQTQFRAALALPPWQLVASGTIGCFMLVGRTWLVPRIGVQATMALVMVGQLLSAAAFEHFGALGFPQHPFTAVRALGLLLLIGGMVLIIR